MFRNESREDEPPSQGGLYIGFRVAGFRGFSRIQSYRVLEINPVCAGINKVYRCAACVYIKGAQGLDLYTLCIYIVRHIDTDVYIYIHLHRDMYMHNYIRTDTSPSVCIYIHLHTSSYM